MRKTHLDGWREFSLFSHSGSNSTVKAFLLSFMRPSGRLLFIVQLPKFSLFVTLTLFVSLIDSVKSECSDKLSQFASGSLFATNVDEKFLPLIILIVNYLVCTLLRNEMKNFVDKKNFTKINCRNIFGNERKVKEALRFRGTFMRFFLKLV